MKPTLRITIGAATGLIVTLATQTTGEQVIAAIPLVGDFWRWFFMVLGLAATAWLTLQLPSEGDDDDGFVDLPDPFPSLEPSLYGDSETASPPA